jgi:hypothetical protein
MLNANEMRRLSTTIDEAMAELDKEEGKLSTAKDSRDVARKEAVAAQQEFAAALEKFPIDQIPNAISGRFLVALDASAIAEKALAATAAKVTHTKKKFINAMDAFAAIVKAQAVKRPSL